MNDFIYLPYVLKMAHTKRTALRGKARAKLDNLIAAVQAADDNVMCTNPDYHREAWDAAHDAAQGVAAELLAFADPIMPVEG